MAIIYSYPQGSSALSSDVLVITRIDEEENQITTKQLTVGQIADYAATTNDIVTGTGTPNYLPVWGPDGISLVDSSIVFDGSNSTSVAGDLIASNDLVADRDLSVTRTANVGSLNSADITSTTIINANNIESNKLVLNPEGEISNPVSNTSTLLFAKTTTDNTTQISVNKKLTLSGSGDAGVLNFLEFAEIESSSVFPALELNSGGTPQITGKQLRSEFKGQGGVHRLYANVDSTELGGDLDKDIRLIYSDSQSCKLNGTGSDTIYFISPYFANLKGSNDNATITNYCGFVSTEFTTGAITITDSYIGFGSYGLKNANLVVNEYIGYYHDSPQANLATESYFMKNIVDMPLDTMGSVVSKDYKLKALNTAPSSSTDTGVLGEIRYTSDAIYVCIATDTWRKSELLNF